MLVPKLSYIGAAIAWCITESMLVIMEGIAIKKECKDINIKYINSSLIKYIISVICMAIPIVLIKSIIKNNILVIFISVTISPFIYVFSCILLKDEISLNILEQLKSKFTKNKIVDNKSLE